MHTLTFITNRLWCPRADSMINSKRQISRELTSRQQREMARLVTGIAALESRYADGCSLDDLQEDYSRLLPDAIVAGGAGQGESGQDAAQGYSDDGAAATLRPRLQEAIAAAQAQRAKPGGKATSESKTKGIDDAPATVAATSDPKAPPPAAPKRRRLAR